MTPLETLQHIQQRLANDSPGPIIAALLPNTAGGAVTWARRLPGWEEYPFPAQVIAIARVISRRALREYSLRLTEDGRVVKHQEGKAWQQPSPAATFRLGVNGEEIQVEYTPGYFPTGDNALVSFTSPRPHCLSETGHWSLFVPRDAVEAAGGPQAFAASLAEAKLQGREQDFMAVFEGKAPEQRRRHARPKAPVGEHSARVIVQPQSPENPPPEEGMLF